MAIVDGGLRLSYLEWARRIGAVQRRLADAGLARGDHLLVVLQNRWEMGTLHWARQFAGIVMTPLNWRAKPEEIDYCLVDAEAKAIVWGARRGRRGGRFLRSESGAAHRVGEVHGATVRFEDWIEAAAEPVPQAEASDWSPMLYTSGTTGRPKGVPRRQRAERIAALAHVAQNRAMRWASAPWA